MYYTYIVRCADNSLYTGITTDIDRRLSEHSSNKLKSAKYTLARPVISLEAVWSSADRSAASALEYRIKSLTKAKKEALIKSGDLSYAFGDKIDICLYVFHRKK